MVGYESGVWEQEFQLAAALGGGPAGIRKLDLESASLGGQRLEMLLPLLPWPREHQREQDVVEFIGIAHLGYRLVPHALDRAWVEPAELARLDRQAAPQRHGPRAPLADFGVLVEERERLAVQDLVCEHARLDGGDEMHPDRL